MKFIDKQLSIKLKEKGFDKPCFGYYYIETPTGLTDGELVLSRYYGRGGTFMDTLKRHDLPYTTSNIIDAPTIDQILEWLREEKEIMLWMKTYHTYATKNHICWDWNISIVNENHELSKHCSDEGFSKYEDAAIAGINFIVEHLI